MSIRKRILLPSGIGIISSLFLAGIYIGILSWAERLQHAVDFFLEDRWILIPVISGFGVQMALCTALNSISQSRHMCSPDPDRKT